MLERVPLALPTTPNVSTRQAYPHVVRNLTRVAQPSFRPGNFVVYVMQIKRHVIALWKNHVRRWRGFSLSYPSLRRFATRRAPRRRGPAGSYPLGPPKSSRVRHYRNRSALSTPVLTTVLSSIPQAIQHPNKRRDGFQCVKKNSLTNIFQQKLQYVK